MSTKSLEHKLQIKEDQKFLLVNPPKGYKESLSKLPKGLNLHTDRNGQANVIQVVLVSRGELEKQLI